MDDGINLYVNRLRAVGEASRLRILALLMRGELAVGELAQILDQSQPRLSHHLKALTGCGLVERMPEGAWVFYSVPATGPVRAFLDAIMAHIDPQQGEFAKDAWRLSLVRAARTDAATAYFSEMADTWDTVRDLHSANEGIENHLVKLAGSDSFNRVLDIGTGTGRMLSLFAEHAERLDGVDLSHRMLTVARANLDRDGITHAHVRQGDAANLPYDDGSADLIIIHQVLHFVDEPERVVAEASRVLSANGKLLIVDFAPHSLEFLREEHGHRRLGVRHEALAEWSAGARLGLSHPQTFEQPEGLSEGLTVQIWSASKVAAKRHENEGITV